MSSQFWPLLQIRTSTCFVNAQNTWLILLLLAAVFFLINQRLYWRILLVLVHIMTHFDDFTILTIASNKNVNVLFQCSKQLANVTLVGYVPVWIQSTTLLENFACSRPFQWFHFRNPWSPACNLFLNFVTTLHETCHSHLVWYEMTVRCPFAPVRAREHMK